MQSLYKVIKNTSVVNNGKKEIVTQYVPPAEEEVEVLKEVNVKEFIESYENLAKTMLEKARRQGESIISKAYEEAEKIEGEAYPTAYEKGYKEGSEKGYKEAYEEAYEKNITKVREERENIIKEAQQISENMIKSAKEEYIQYLNDKKEEIRFLIENIVQCVFKREIKDKDALNSAIMETLENVKNSKTVIVKCKSIYEEELNKTIDLWKIQNAFKGDIFLIVDDSLEEGKVIIEKDNGKIVISKESALEKIKEIINS